MMTLKEACRAGLHLKERGVVGDGLVLIAKHGQIKCVHINEGGRHRTQFVLVQVACTQLVQIMPIHLPHSKS